MAHSPLVLAALASAAMPGTNAIGVRGYEVPGDYDGAEITFADGKKLIASAPATVIAGANQEAELALLEELQHRVEANELPFAVPEIVASAPLPEGGRIVLSHPLSGSPIEPAALRPGPGLTSNVGRAIAAIHELPTALLERLEFPIYTAKDYRERHSIELDAAAGTNFVPPVLLSRWEANLDDGDIWQFEPVVLHGDLAPELMLVNLGRVSTISGWANARVADPADDLAWLIAAAPEDAGDALIKAYQTSRPSLNDPGLVDRAMLISELALARWLQYGLRENLPEVVTDATTMLTDLAAAVA